MGFISKLLGISPVGKIGIDKVVIASNYVGILESIEEFKGFYAYKIVFNSSLKGSFIDGKYEIIRRINTENNIDGKAWNLKVGEHNIKGFLIEFDNMIGNQHYLIFHVMK